MEVMPELNTSLLDLNLQCVKPNSALQASLDVHLWTPKMFLIISSCSLSKFFKSITGPQISLPLSDLCPHVLCLPLVPIYGPSCFPFIISSVSPSRCLDYVPGVSS